MSLDNASAKAVLGKLLHPTLNRPLSLLEMVGEVTVDGGRVSAHIDLEAYEGAPREKVEEAARAALEAAGATAVELDWGVKALPRPIGDEDPCPTVRNIILVTSGKGGVGKSTVAANLALALQDAGQRVGLLDADIYGPSVPTMLGIAGRPEADADGNIIPLERYGLKLMSIGFLLDSDKTAVIWRGPMLQGALLQFLKDVRWGELDFLVLDLPPGTGDVALTLAQRVKTTGAVVVTTPQAVALADVYKAVAMMKKVDIAVLGVIENESYFICDGCDKRHELFGAGGGAEVATFAEVPLLGQIPLHPAVREWSDAGTPIVRAAPDCEVAESFREVARKVMDRASAANAARAPKLTIDRSGGTNRHLPIAR